MWFCFSFVGKGAGQTLKKNGHVHTFRKHGHAHTETAKHAHTSAISTTDEHDVSIGKGKK